MQNKLDCVSEKACKYDVSETRNVASFPSGTNKFLGRPNGSTIDSKPEIHENKIKKRQKHYVDK